MDTEKALAIVKAMRPAKSSEVPVRLRHTALPGDRANPTGFIYFVYCAGRIKIGFTTNVADRMNGLATSSPFPISLLLTIAGDIEDEQMMHCRFAGDRANLEWFTASTDLLDFLDDKLCDDGMVILTNAQFESRVELLQCIASVVNETGGDEAGCAIKIASWPRLLQPCDRL